MAYIGKQPVVGNFVKLDAITTSATATYNLLNGGVAYFPQTANNCIVSLNGVIQSPTSAYTISGSTIVFSDALTASDSIDFILVLGDVLNIGTPSDGTVGFAKVTSNLITGATAETSIAGGDSVLIYDDSAAALRKMTRTNFVSGIGGTNTPAFVAKPTSTQSITANTWTKINFGTEIVDTDGNFASSRFTPTTAGYYFIYSSIDQGNTNDYFYLNIYKNGSSFVGGTVVASQAGGMDVQTIMYFNGSSDYVEAYTYQGTGTGSISPNTQGSTFGGFKLIGV
jgi:hypothetical protein